MESRKSKLKAIGITAQPNLIVVGSRWINITDFYIAIDDNIAYLASHSKVDIWNIDGIR